MIGTYLAKVTAAPTRGVVDQRLAFDAPGMAVVTGLRYPAQLGSGDCPIDGDLHLSSKRLFAANAVVSAQRC